MGGDQNPAYQFGSISLKSEAEAQLEAEENKQNQVEEKKEEVVSAKPQEKELDSVGDGGTDLGGTAE